MEYQNEGLQTVQMSQIFQLIDIKPETCWNTSLPIYLVKQRWALLELNYKTAYRNNMLVKLPVKVLFPLFFSKFTNHP